jgi:hypothetical protein
MPERYPDFVQGIRLIALNFPGNPMAVEESQGASPNKQPSIGEHNFTASVL